MIYRIICLTITTLLDPISLTVGNQVKKVLKSQFVLLIAVLFAVWVSTVALVSDAQAATITVTTTEDVLDAGTCSTLTPTSLNSNPGPDGFISLREAVCAANNNPGLDIINLGPGVYTLTIPSTNENFNVNGDLDISGDLKINGLDANSTIIDGTNIDRVLSIWSGSGVITVDINNVTIQNGTADNGAGIRSLGTVNLTNCIITNNTATDDGGGIQTYGTLNISNTLIISNQATGGTSSGGGIFCTYPGAANISNSTIASNTTSGLGGGIGSACTLNMINSTIFDNKSSRVDVWGAGGISHEQYVANIANSTISGNSANLDGGGIRIAHNGIMNLTHVTITNNTADNDNNGTGSGGGVYRYQSGTINIKNSIIAGNFDTPGNLGSGATTPDCDSTFSPTTPGYNFIGNNSGCTTFFPAGNPNTNDDFVGTSASPLDPLLRPLTGSPAYHPLQAASLAIDKIPTANCTFISSDPSPLFTNGAHVTFDQPGTARSAQCDIGAFEASSEIQVTDGITDVSDNSGSVDFSTTPVGIPITKTFTVRNTGEIELILTPPITAPTGFSVASSFGDTSLAAGEQTTFVVQLEAASSGTFMGELAFANNDVDENPFNFVISGAVKTPSEIQVVVGATNVPDNSDGVEFGATIVGSPITKTFTVSNTGEIELILTPPITAPTGFSVVSSFGDTSLAAGEQTTFIVQLEAASSGTFMGELAFNNTDVDKNPFNFIINGTVKTAYKDVYLPIILK